MIIRLVFVLTSVLLPTQIIAQIDATFFPVYPDTILMASQASNVSEVAGGNGPGQEWDFSSFIGSDIDTVFFTDPSASSFTYPGANLWLNQVSISPGFVKPSFYHVDANRAVIHGNLLNVGTSTIIDVPFSTELTDFIFPTALGDWFTDTVSMFTVQEGADVGMPMADSVRLNRIVYRVDTIGASGTLHLSSASYSDVLRKTTTDTQIDTIFQYVSGSGWSLVSTETRYFTTHRWLSHSVPFSLAELYAEGESNEVKTFRSRPYNPGVISYNLEFGNLPTTLVEGQTPSPFTVTVRHAGNGQIATSYAVDSIRISGAGSINGNLAAQVNNGVATFSGVGFIESGLVEVTAYAPSCAPLTQVVNVIKLPDSLAFYNVASTVNQGQILPTFDVYAYNVVEGEAPVLNTAYTGNVHIGKKSGAGAITGSVSKPLVNGIATFDDVSFQYADDYELVAYMPKIESPDTVTVSVQANPNGAWIYHFTDTLNQYIERASEFYWMGGGYSGYAPGPSRVPLWTEIGQQFDFDGSAKLTEILMHGSFYQKVGPEKDSITVTIYQAGVNEIVAQGNITGSPDTYYYVDSMPKQELARIYIPDDTLLEMNSSEFYNQRPFSVYLEEPVAIHGPFVIAVQTNYENGVNDTLVLLHNIPGDGQQEFRNSRRVINNDFGYSDGTWLPEYIAQAFSLTDYDYMIAPILEVDTFVVGAVFMLENHDLTYSIRPTITQELVRVSGALEKAHAIRILDSSGREVKQWKLTSDNTARISLAGLRAGVYFVQPVGQFYYPAQRVVKIE